MAKYAASSQQLGKSLNTLLTTPGTKEADVENELSGLAQQQEKLTEQARSLDPPGRLRKEHAHMLDSFDLRTNGLNGMSAVFETVPARRATRAGNELAQQMQRLVASDVIWEDLFKDPTKERAREPEHHRRQRAELGLHCEPRHREHGFDEVLLAASPRRRDGRLDL